MQITRNILSFFFICQKFTFLLRSTSSHSVFANEFVHTCTQILPNTPSILFDIFQVTASPLKNLTVWPYKFSIFLPEHHVCLVHSKKILQNVYAA